VSFGADSPLVAAGKFGLLAKGLAGLEKEVLLQGGLIVKRSVQAQLVAAGAGSGRLRGVGKKGAKVGVRVDPLGRAVLVRATGPVHLLESKTRAHRIPKDSRASTWVISIPGVGVRAFANVKGTKGKYPWAKGVVAAAPMVGKANQVALTKTLGAVFR